ncbi:MAG: hypothetical protein ACI9MC_003739, partial [Kiritimatiellia bacterium]
ASFRESERKSQDRVDFEETILARTEIKATQGAFSVNVVGRELSATLGSVQVDVTLAEEPNGYLGLRVKGSGRATLSAPRTK